MARTKPLEGEYAPYYHTYIGKVPQADLIEALKDNGEKVVALLQSIPEDKRNYKYAPGKWTITELISHVIDAERVFAYRALTFSRNDKAQLPGFDENAWTPESNATNRTLKSMIDEYQHLRTCNLLMFESFTNEMLMRIGNASGKDVSVRALGYIIAGHEIHHIQVLKERYL